MTNPQNDFAPSVDFLKLVPDLWNGRKLILGCTALTIVVAAAISLLMPETFESETALLLMPPPFKEVKDEISSMIPKVLSVADYEILLHSDGVLVEAIKRVKDEAATLQGVWTTDDLALLDELSSVRKRLSIEVDITEKNVTSMRYSPIIRLTARASTARQAQHLAEAWGEVAIETAKTLYIKGKSGVLEFMESGFQSAKKELTDLNGQIRDVEIEWNDELENARLGRKHSRLIEYEEGLLDNEMKLATLTKEMEALEAAQAQEQQTLTIWKSPPMDAVFLQRELSNAGKSATSTDRQINGEPVEKRHGYEEEVLNQTYFDIQARLVSKRAELSGLEEARRQFQDAITELDSELQDLRREAAVRNYERKILDLQVAPLQKAYELLAAKLEQAKVIESEMSNLADIKIIAEAQLPDKKSFPPRSLIVLAAGLLGFLCATGYVVGRGVIRRSGVFDAA